MTPSMSGRTGNQTPWLRTLRFDRALNQLGLPQRRRKVNSVPSEHERLGVGSTDGHDFTICR